MLIRQKLLSDLPVQAIDVWVNTEALASTTGPCTRPYGAIKRGYTASDNRLAIAESESAIQINCYRPILSQSNACYDESAVDTLTDQYR